MTPFSDEAKIKNAIKIEKQFEEMLKDKAVGLKQKIDFLLASAPREIIETQMVNLFIHSIYMRKDDKVLGYLSALANVDYPQRAHVNIEASNAMWAICKQISKPKTAKLIHNEMKAILYSARPELLFGHACFIHTPTDWQTIKMYDHKGNHSPLLDINTNWQFNAVNFAKLTAEEIEMFRLGASRYFANKLAQDLDGKKELSEEKLDDWIDTVAEFCAVEDSIFMSAKAHREALLEDTAMRLADEVRVAVIGAEKHKFFEVRSDLRNLQAELQKFGAMRRGFSCPAFEKIEHFERLREAKRIKAMRESEKEPK